MRQKNILPLLLVAVGGYYLYQKQRENAAAAAAAGAPPLNVAKMANAAVFTPVGSSLPYTYTAN